MTSRTSAWAPKPSARPTTPAPASTGVISRPRAHSDESTSITTSSTAAVTRSSGSKVSSRALASGPCRAPGGGTRLRRWSIAVRTVIQTTWVSSARVATPTRRNDRRTSGLSAAASEASGASSTTAPSASPARTTTKRAAESTMFGSTRSSSSRQKKNTSSRSPICNAITAAAIAAIVPHIGLSSQTE